MSSSKKSSAGSSLIEVLVTLVILMLGLLGMAGLQSRALSAQMEAYQRSQALALLKDMVDRLNLTRGNAEAVGTTLRRGMGFNSSAILSCAGLAGTALDLCEWHNALLGAAETQDAGGGATTNVGAMVGARGCIYKIAANEYLVAVAWQGMSRSAVNASIDCGSGQYGGDAYRRVISAPVTMATLN